MSAKRASARDDDEELGDRLREAGLRKTPPRVAVLRFLDRAKSAISHGELAEAFASSKFDRATLYRNLMDLVEVDLVTRTDLGDHVWRFAVRKSADVEGETHASAHPHFVCTSCGKITCLPSDALRIAAKKGLPKSSPRQQLELQVRGQCDACA